MTEAITLERLYRKLVCTMEQSGLDDAERSARYILQKRVGAGWGDIIAHPDQPVSKENYLQVIADLDAYTQGKPLSRIYAEREFYGLTFALSNETLDPRIDTELLVDLALERMASVQKPQILDLGTGSGCILLSILHHHKKATGIGLDIAQGAVKTAALNARSIGVNERAQFVCGDWAAAIAGKFDVIVSNPPYISPEVIPNLCESVRHYDPITALEGGEDGLREYKKIFFQLHGLLKPGGTALFEIGYDQEEGITRLGEESRFLLRGVHRDSGGQPRVAEFSF